MAIEISTTIHQLSATASEGRARQHHCRIDRPASKGGSDQGPMGGELLLIGIGGCFMSNLLAAVTKAGLLIDDLSVTVTASLESDPPRFDKIRLAVHTASPDHEQLGPLIAQAEAACIAINTAKTGSSVTINLA
jgi:putative redox protein